MQHRFRFHHLPTFLPLSSHMQNRRAAQPRGPPAVSSRRPQAFVMPLLSLPPKVITKIFLIVCTDGGSTACALSLVSRKLHQLVKPIAFSSVALNGLRAVYSMVGRWRRAPEDAKPVVEHLLLTNDMDIRMIQRPPPPRERKYSVHDFEGALADDREVVMAFEQAVTDLLTAFASTLRSLHILVYGIFNLGMQKIFRGLNFPVLNHVAMNLDSENIFAMPNNRFAPVMPLLTTLEVDLGGHPKRLKVIQYFIRACPTIRRVVMKGFTETVHGRYTPTYLLGFSVPPDSGFDITPVNLDFQRRLFGANGSALLKVGDTVEVLSQNGFDAQFRPGNIIVVEVYPCRRGYSPENQIDGLIVHPKTNDPPTYQEARTQWERRMQVNV
jgi:hypothetical protein